MKIQNNRLYLRVEPISKLTGVKNNNQGSNNKQGQNNKKNFSEIFEEELNKYRNKKESSQY